MGKPSKETIIRAAEAINKLDLVEPIVIDDDIELVLADFMTAIEEIDDLAKLDEVPSEFVDLYEDQVEDGSPGDDEDDEEEERRKEEERKRKEEERKRKEEEERKRKEAEAAKSKRGTRRRSLRRRGTDPEPEPETDPDPEPETTSSRRSRRSRKETTTEETTSSRRSRKETTTEEKKEKANKSGLPKGFRVNTLPAKIYELLKEGTEEKPVTMYEVAELIADVKDKKDPERLLSNAYRTLARKVSANVDIVIYLSGNEDTAKVFLSEEED